jgi:hypothetical protein
MSGYDWTQEYDDEPQLREIPAEMFEPSIQDVEWEKAGKPIKPIKRIDYDEMSKRIDEAFRKILGSDTDENNM